MEALMTQEEMLVSLMQQHQTGIWRYLRMLGCERSLADDLTQDVFVGYVQKPFVDLGPAAAAAYLRKAARHLFLNWLRNNKRTLPLEIDAASEAAWADLTPGDDSDERIEALRRCLEKLAQRQREALDLKYRDCRSEVEVAKAMDATVDAIKGLLKRTREQLRQCVQKQVRP